MIFYRKLCFNVRVSKRGYKQCCPLAYGLDIIGERWTLLIIRELSLGPRRFSDIQKGLPSLGANLLSARLRALEANKIIDKQYLPPPAATHVYTLAKAGQALLEVLASLVNWSIHYAMPTPKEIPECDYLSTVSTISALRMFFMPEKAKELQIITEVHLLPDVFTVHIKNSDLNLVQGSAKAPDVTIQTDQKTFLKLITKAQKLDSIPANKISFKGSHEALVNFLESFSS